MAMITLHNASLPEVTILSNTFIDNYMPEANGEFVKVYIYLLRALSSAPVSFSLEQMADRLLCTERDILRALKYWAKQQLLTLDFTDNNKLCGISLLTPVAPSCPTDAVQDEISVTSEQPKDQPVVRTEALTPPISALKCIYFCIHSETCESSEKESVERRNLHRHKRLSGSNGKSKIKRIKEFRRILYGCSKTVSVQDFFVLF